MKKALSALAAVTLGLSSAALLPSAAEAQAGPPVKMSKSRICHPRGGTHYNRTKKFKPYPSMQACIEAGERPSKT